MKIWTGVVTEKLQASKTFYIELFGCEVVFESDWFVLLELGGAELGFMLPGLETQASHFQQPFKGQGLWVAIDVEDVDSELKRLQSLGIPIVHPMRDEPWGDRHFVIEDPNGIGVDIVQHGHN